MTNTLTPPALVALGPFQDMAEGMKNTGTPVHAMLFLVIGGAFVLLIALILIARYYSTRKKQLLQSNSQFFLITEKLNLSKREIRFLVRMSRNHAISNPLALLTSPSLWENFLDKALSRKQQQTCQSLYQKLFGKKLTAK